jgi:hypothetical protein
VVLHHNPLHVVQRLLAAARMQLQILPRLSSVSRWMTRAAWNDLVERGNRDSHPDAGASPRLPSPRHRWYPPITCKLPIPRSSPRAVGNSRTRSLNLFAATFRDSLLYSRGSVRTMTLRPALPEEP